MKKLKLSLESLSVVSFETRDEVETRPGTVKGNQATYIQCTQLSGCCLTDWDSCYAADSCGCGTGGPTHCPTE